MDEWRGRVDELLYAGESIEERIGVGDADVVVTTHRVLALTPSGDGERYRAIDRPNVLGASIDAGGDRGHLLTAGKAGVVAALLFGLDAAVDLGGLLSMSPTDAPVGAAGALETVASALALVDLLLTLAWALPAVVALAFLVRYVVGRGPALRIAVAGGDDVVIPVGENPAVERLERALDFDGR
ncbi:hypothetical protein [Natronoarchaeum rubrum]|uniref:hypothetical protein n=1 Tax=Natronoarchaeum rubrum TaxID=755311 RepID=UPI002111AE39|nr:hypothetical protein [Natronoarchaeum rubrum]